MSTLSFSALLFCTLYATGYAIDTCVGDTCAASNDIDDAMNLMQHNLQLQQHHHKSSEGRDKMDIHSEALLHYFVEVEDEEDEEDDMDVLEESDRRRRRTEPRRRISRPDRRRQWNPESPETSLQWCLQSDYPNCSSLEWNKMECMTQESENDQGFADWYGYDALTHGTFAKVPLGNGTEAVAAKVCPQCGHCLVPCLESTYDKCMTPAYKKVGMNRRRINQADINCVEETIEQTFQTNNQAAKGVDVCPICSMCTKPCLGSSEPADCSITGLNRRRSSYSSGHRACLDNTIQVDGQDLTPAEVCPQCGLCVPSQYFLFGAGAGAGAAGAGAAAAASQQ